jgi:hypothetical protein
MSDTAKKLSAELEAFFAAKELNTAPAWRPSPGDTLIGEVTGLRMGNDNGYGTYPIVVVKREDGTVASMHAFHTLLREQLRDLGCNIGMRIAVTYDGERITNETADLPEKDQKTYHLYFAADLAKLGTAEGAAPVETGFSFD